MLDMGMTMSYEQLLIDAEIIKMTRRIMEGIRFNDDTLAVKVIEAVGPAGEYLGQRHTLKYMRQETSTSTLIERRMYESWERDGRKDMAQRAHEEAVKLLASHQPAPLEPGVAKAIHAIVEEAAAELAEKKAFRAK
jgi:trimethylamine--corrinoid protein Co-methyltransferase